MTQGTWPRSRLVRSTIFSLLIPCGLTSSNIRPSMQPSWEAEFDALGTTKRTVGPWTAATHDTVDPDAIAKLQELLSLSASQILERKGLDSVGACLNDLATDGRLDIVAVTRASSLLERASGALWNLCKISPSRERMEGRLGRTGSSQSKS